MKYMYHLDGSINRTFNLAPTTRPVDSAATAWYSIIKRNLNPPKIQVPLTLKVVKEAVDRLESLFE